jgi:anti-sigma regulatory factor (Ser/Thr protein kinase)
MHRITVTEASQVAEARRRAVAVAQGIGFDETAAGRVALVVTELATNVVKYGVPGEVLVGTYEDGTGSGVEILALDKGNGCQDLGLALRDGHSTGGSAGEGLGAVRRLSDAFDIVSRPGLGTAVLARLSIDRTRTPDGVPGFGAVTVPLKGETANGDAYAVRERDDGWTAVVSDGLGHGPPRRPRRPSSCSGAIATSRPRRSSPRSTRASPTPGAARSPSRATPGIVPPSRWPASATSPGRWSPARR